MPSAREVELKQSEVTALLALALQALQLAPHKHRLDFPPYWTWYDGERATTVHLLEEHLKAK